MNRTEIIKKTKLFNQYKNKLRKECYTIFIVDDNSTMYFWEEAEFNRYFQDNIWSKKAFKCLNEKTWYLAQDNIVYMASIRKNAFAKEKTQDDFIHDMLEQGLI